MNELGNLSQCMVDSDAAAKTRARRLRRKALTISIVAQALVIATVMLSPLATLGVLPAREVVVPLPPFHGAQEPQQRTPQPPHASHGNAPAFQPTLRQPPAIPQHVDMGPGPEPPTIDAGNGPDGPGVPGGLGDGPVPIEIARPTPPPTRTVRRSGEIMAALLVHRVEPEYPPIAKTMRLSGTVILHAKIGTDGKVHEVEIMSGNVILAQAAVAAVRQWRYQPTLLNSQPVEVETEVTVNFVLNE